MRACQPLSGGPGRPAIEKTAIMATMVPMSEHLIRFHLGELTLVRLVCQACKGVVEVSMPDLARTFTDARCPLCTARYAAPGDPNNPFVALSKAAATLALVGDRVRVEFVLPQK